MIGLSAHIRQFLLSLLLFITPALGHAAGVLVLGDSISAAYGLNNPAQGWVSLLAEQLKTTGKPLAINNASLSGETSAGGLNRVDELLARHKPAWLLLELGANDGLRGLNPAQMQANLTEIIRRAQHAGAKVMLLGMRIPPNYGKRYNALFEAVFTSIAQAEGVAYVPFLLEGIGGHAELMQADGLHPNAQAQPMMMQRVWAVLESRL